MIKHFIFTLIFSSLIFFSSFGQNIYPNKFEGCNTEQFGLESESIIAKKDKEFIAELIIQNINEKIRKDIRGILKIQVIAYEDKSSCMISYDNATNFSDEKLGIGEIKKIIDKDLIWDNVEETVSPMIELYFLIGEVKVKRIGFNGNKGKHELTD